MGLKAEMVLTAADARMSDLLDAVRKVFAAKGFERASMQDLAKAANMSAGNFYRYFPSKDAIIEAMVQRELDYIEVKFQYVKSSDDPIETLREGLAEQLSIDDPEDCAIWAEIIAAANRREEIAVLFARLEAAIVGSIAGIFAQVAGIDPKLAARRYDAHARMMFMIIQGIKMRQRRHDGVVTEDLRGLALRTLNDILDDVRPASPRPGLVAAEESH